MNKYQQVPTDFSTLKLTAKQKALLTQETKEKYTNEIDARDTADLEEIQSAYNKGELIALSIVLRDLETRLKDQAWKMAPNAAQLRDGFDLGTIYGKVALIKYILEELPAEVEKILKERKKKQKAGQAG